MSPQLFDEWLKSCLADESIRAKSLLVTILGDSVAPHGGEIWLGSLIELLAPFGVNERLVRTSVYRLAHEGWLEITRSGRRSRYAVSAAGRRRIEHANRRIYGEPTEQWDGTWTLVLADSGSWTSTQRADLKRDLLWEGFAALAPGLYGHPSAASDSLLEILDTLDARSRVVVLESRAVPLAGGLTDAQLVRNNWPLRSLAERYEAFCFRFAPFLDGAAAALDPARAFQLCTLLIHGYRRVVLRDPQLPSRLLPQNWPGHRAFVECAMIYSQAAEQAEVHFGESLADPLTPAAQAFQIRKRRFHAASHLPAQTDPA